MKTALPLIVGIMIGVGLMAALPPAPPVVERIHVPHYQEKLVPTPVERECHNPPRITRATCPPHRSLESLAMACAEGRLTHDGRVGILLEGVK